MYGSDCSVCLRDEMPKLSVSEPEELWNIRCRDETQLDDAPNDAPHQLRATPSTMWAASGDEEQIAGTNALEFPRRRFRS
jgi:hypothetical protein